MYLRLSLTLLFFIAACRGPEPESDYQFANPGQSGSVLEQIPARGEAASRPVTAYSPGMVTRVPIESGGTAGMPAAQNNQANTESAKAPVTANAPVSTHGKSETVTKQKKVILQPLSEAYEKATSVVIEQFLEVAEPEFMRGIYLSNLMVRDSKRFPRHIRDAAANDINTMVLDVQPRMLKSEQVLAVKRAGIYPVARVVVFEGGLKTPEPAPGYIEGILSTMEQAAGMGFHEIQLDYIRFADEGAVKKLPLKQKYAVLDSILSRARTKADALGVKLSCDVFGRITLNYDDVIGQKLENYGKHIHNIYPMVYPSHYYGDEFRTANPYLTVKEGMYNTKSRIPNVRAMAYIQGFKMKIQSSNLNLEDYIQAQLRAVDDAGADGWVIWNPRNVYEPSYRAIRNHKEKRESASLQAALRRKFEEESPRKGKS